MYSLDFVHRETRDYSSASKDQPKTIASKKTSTLSSRHDAGRPLERPFYSRLWNKNFGDQRRRMKQCPKKVNIYTRHIGLNSFRYFIGDLSRLLFLTFLFMATSADLLDHILTETLRLSHSRTRRHA